MNSNGRSPVGGRIVACGKGQALIEASLLVPMIFFLFLGLTNFGFYIYAFITVSNAARAAAQYTANLSLVGDDTAACDVALREMQSLPNVAPLIACTAPLQVTADDYVEPTFGTQASRVTITYETIQLFPLPFMAGKMTIHRTAVIGVITAS